MIFSNKGPFVSTDGWTDGLAAGRHTDRLTGRQRETEMRNVGDFFQQGAICKYGRTGGLAADRQTGTHTDRQKDIQIEIEMITLTSSLRLKIKRNDWLLADTCFKIKRND